MEWIIEGIMEWYVDYSDTHGTLGGDAVTDVTAVVTMFGPWEGKQAYIFNVTCFVTLSATTSSFAHIFCLAIL